MPDAAVSSRRPKGAWVPFYNVITAVALPIVMSVYAGVAEAARDLALDHDFRLHNFLRACADDPVMRDEQDRFFDEAPCWRATRAT